MALVSALVILSVVVVDETQYVIVTDFGRIAAVYGDGAGETGFHLKSSTSASGGSTTRSRSARRCST
jgi:hypothetical protein